MESKYESTYYALAQSLKLMAVFFIHSIIVFVLFFNECYRFVPFSNGQKPRNIYFYFGPCNLSVVIGKYQLIYLLFRRTFLSSRLKRKWLDWQFAKTDFLQFPCSFDKKVPFVLDFSDDTDFLGSLGRGFFLEGKYQMTLQLFFTFNPVTVKCNVIRTFKPDLSSINNSQQLMYHLCM